MCLLDPALCEASPGDHLYPPILSQHNANQEPIQGLLSLGESHTYMYHGIIIYCDLLIAELQLLLVREILHMYMYA